MDTAVRQKMAAIAAEVVAEVRAAGHAVPAEADEIVRLASDPAVVAEEDPGLYKTPELLWEAKERAEAVRDLAPSLAGRLAIGAAIAVAKDGYAEEPADGAAADADAIGTVRHLADGARQAARLGL